MHLVYSFMKNNHSLHNIPTRQKSRLGQLDNLVGYRCESVCQYFCENLEAHIKEVDVPILLNFQRLYTLWQQNDRAEVEAK
jgi:hypothetical protein